MTAVKVLFGLNLLFAFLNFAFFVFDGSWPLVNLFGMAAGIAGAYVLYRTGALES